MLKPPPPRHTALALAAIAVSLTVAACAGFDLGDVVRVKTPNHIQHTTGLPRTTTLNTAAHEYQAWLDDVQRNATQWKASIDRADDVRAVLDQLTLTALNDAGPTLAGIPVAGPALPALTAILGLTLGSARLRKEKEASFNKGLAQANNRQPNT